MSSRPDHLHNEALLQWIWETLQFNVQDLTLRDGKKLQILDPGQLNETDGPDFKQAVLLIDNLEWHGDVELHLKETGWYEHKHHTDPNYNSVILHVVTEDNSVHPVRREEGTHPFHLNLKPYINRDLQYLIERFHQEREIPCGGTLSFLNSEVFARQLQKAHREYFEHKVDDLLEWFDPNLLPTEAWKRMLVKAYFDGLGISHNRSAMRQLFDELYTKAGNKSPLSHLIKKARKRSGFMADHETSPPIQWNRKACRPNNRPEVRVQQACAFMHRVQPLDLHLFIENNPESSWQELIGKIAPDHTPGTARTRILFGTVFLPSLYLLGTLWASDSIKNSALDTWQNLKSPVPKSLLKRLDKTEINKEIYRHKLGTVYQLREYCDKHRCQNCKVLKSAIST